jgi:ABC-type transport system involved in multi-copper enzyme maturation permease subunit
MGLLKGILFIFLVLGFLMGPSCVFAYESSGTGSGSFSGYSKYFSSFENNLNPLVKGSSGGGKSSSSSSKKIKTDSDDDGNSTDDDSGSSWLWIVLIIVIILIIVGVWFFFLRNR